jgi:hypothetical protein
VLLKSWDLCHLKANDLSYSRKFESLHFHAQINFYGISKFTEQAKSLEHFQKKIVRARSARNGPRRSRSSPDPARQRRRLNLPVGSGCQRPRVTESVSSDFDRPIRTEIDDAGLSSPSHRGLDKTLALATGDGGARLTEGRRGRPGWLQGCGSLSEVFSASEACRRRCSRVVRGHAHSRGPRVPSMMAAFSRCQRGNEMRGEAQI